VLLLLLLLLPQTLLVLLALLALLLTLSLSLDQVAYSLPTIFAATAPVAGSMHAGFGSLPDSVFSRGIAYESGSPTAVDALQYPPAGITAKSARAAISVLDVHGTGDGTVPAGEGNKLTIYLATESCCTEDRHVAIHTPRVMLRSSNNGDGTVPAGDAKGSHSNKAVTRDPVHWAYTGTQSLYKHSKWSPPDDCHVSRPQCSSA